MSGPVAPPPSCPAIRTEVGCRARRRTLRRPSSGFWRRQRQARAELETDMSDDSEHVLNERTGDRSGILVGYDASPAAESALGWAAREAVRRGRCLTVVHAVDFGGLEVDPTIAHVDDWRSRATDAGRTVADEGARLAADVAEGVRARGMVGSGSAARVLVEQSRHAELVVVGNRGRGEFASAWLGSVSMAVATHAHCPTVILRHDAAAPLGPEIPVVVGVDGSAASTAALDVAVALAESSGSSLRIVSAWDPLVEMDRSSVYASALPGGSYGIDDALRARA